MTKQILKFAAFAFALVMLSSSAVPAPGDQDQDGVADDVDRCPNTPIGVLVDPYGCPLF
ncbi:hypothetical protein [Sphingobacterium paramultivorum]|uniref:hypothetical protein n=1 Tax=Sphingobacterium paramultivorum TaxID=2886510 RepID=UPI00192D9255|nr:hypothetical protein [Sphingobacterium paramultivorum]WSO15974.1 hypothetical protein VUL84_05385 [Sphingobacterium paramultivorum]